MMGVGRSACVPSPSCRFPFHPQQYRSPSESRAHVWDVPAEMAVKLACTLTAERVPVVPVLMTVPSPSWPLPLLPQQ